MVTGGFLARPTVRRQKAGHSRDARKKLLCTARTEAQMLRFPGEPEGICVSGKQVRHRSTEGTSWVC